MRSNLVCTLISFILDNIPDDLVEREKFFKKMKKESKKWYLSKRKFFIQNGFQNKRFNKRTDFTAI